MSPLPTMDLCEPHYRLLHERLVRSGGEESIRRIGLVRTSQVLRQESNASDAVPYRSPHLTRAGGIAPSTGCTLSTDVAKKALVPYTADYFFYEAADAVHEGNRIAREKSWVKPRGFSR